MTIDTSYDNLRQEIASAKEMNRKRLAGSKEALARYEGNQDGNAPGGGSPENVEFALVSHRLPQMVFDVPAVRCDSPRIEAAADVAAFDRAFNRWIHDSDTRQVLLETNYDFNLLPWAVLLISHRPAPELREAQGYGGEGVPEWPYMQRIPADTAFKDPRSTSAYRHRFAGHTIIADKEDLLRQADLEPDKWYRKAVEAMAEDGGVADVRLNFGAEAYNAPTRKEVAYDQVWVADAPIDFETELLDEAGNPVPEEKRYLYNGRLYYLACDSGEEIRPSIPYEGPPEGPYVFFGEHIVPNSPYFMNTLTPNAGSISFLNETVEVVNQGIVQHKKIGVVSDFSETLGEVMTNGKSGNVYVIAGYERGQSDVLEVGGVSNQDLQHVAIMRERTERGVGIDDAQSGRADAQASATAVATADAHAGAKTAFANLQWTDGIQRAFYIVGHHIWYKKKFQIAISLPEALALGGKLEDYVQIGPDGEEKLIQPMLQGGTDVEHSFRSVEMVIEPFSTERMSDAVAARRAEALMAISERIGPRVPLEPWTNWDVLMKGLAKYTRIPEVAHLFNLEVAGEMAGVEALLRQAESMEQHNAKAGGGPAKLQSKPAGGGGGAAMPQLTQGAQQPKPQKAVPMGGMVGRAVGGQAGEKSRQAVGAK